MRNEKENWSDPEANNKIIKHGPIKIIFNVFSPLLTFSFLHFSCSHFISLYVLIYLSVFYWFCLSLLLLVVHYLFSSTHSSYCSMFIWILWYDLFISFHTQYPYTPFIPIRFNWEIAMFWGYWKLNLMAVAEIIDYG